MVVKFGGFSLDSTPADQEMRTLFLRELVLELHSMHVRSRSDLAAVNSTAAANENVFSFAMS